MMIYHACVMYVLLGSKYVVFIFEYTGLCEKSFGGDCDLKKMGLS